MGVTRDAVAQGSGNAGGSDRDDGCGGRQRCRETGPIPPGRRSSSRWKGVDGYVAGRSYRRGIGGLSTAVALRATGAHVHVFEQARQLSEVGAGLGLQPNGQRVLVRLGLGPEINRIGVRLKGFRISARDGSVVSEETYPAGVTQLGVHRADMVAVLAAALPAGVVHTGHRCTRFSQHDEFAVVSLTTG
jgi:hypothetical protein